MDVDNRNLIWKCVRKGRSEIHFTDYSWTTVGARPAVAVVGGRAIDEAGEDGMDGRVVISVVGARLETSVTGVRLANEINLLSKIVAGLMGRVCDGERECDIFETRCGDVGYVPSYASADESHG
jgi:hypothetical protein